MLLHTYSHLKKTKILISVVASMIMLTVAAVAAVAADESTIIKVESSALEQLDSVTVKPSEQTYTPTDTAEMLKAVPGANVNKNGPMTGIAQYRGMFGTRVNVQVDGLNVAPAGPNWMDPPLSHLAPVQVDSVTVIRGISPVSAGAESIGGTIKAKTSKLPYATGNEVESHGNVVTGYNSNNSSYTVGGKLGASSNSDRIQLHGNYDKGQDMKAGNGRDIVPTQYQRQNLGVDYGHQFGSGEFNLGYGYEKVDNSGSPALPMDIIYVKGNTFTGGYQSNSDASGVKWLADMHYMDTDHKMDNYSLRKVPLMLGMAGTPPMARHNIANAKDFAYSVQAAIPMSAGTWTMGTDGWIVKHNSDVSDPNNAAFSLQNYNNVTRNRYSLFSEWTSSMADTLDVQFGARYSRVNMNSGQVSSSGFGGMLGTQIKILENNFNNSQLSQNDNLLDLTLQFSQRINDNLTFKIGGARKQRAPSYQERYLWSPLESTAGLADKRTYVGDVNLNPETSYNIDAGFDWKTERTYFTPRIFFKRVKNYIQGTAVSSGTAYNFRVAQGNMLKGGGFCTANPTNPFCVPLQFSNVEAEFYGADTGFGANVTDHISVDGTVSYVRGKRKDIVDNLYRIAPLNSIINLNYFADNDWSATAQTMLYGKQDKVSQTNSEQKTSGYSVFNLQGRYAISRGIEFSAGVNNIFDRFYQDHLSGYNRVSTGVNGQASAVATGVRLPGEGRNYFVQVRGSF